MFLLILNMRKYANSVKKLHLKLNISFDSSKQKLTGISQVWHRDETQNINDLAIKKKDLNS